MGMGPEWNGNGSGIGMGIEPEWNGNRSGVE